MTTDFLLPSTDDIRSYRKKHPREIEKANLLLGLEWEWCSLVIRNESINPFVIVHAQTIHDYHREALLMCIRGRTSIAMALMRMSCELARDNFRLVEKPELVSVWLNRSEDAEKTRRKAFRFDDKHPFELRLLEAYNIYSSFGVHGHMNFPADAGEVFRSQGQNFINLMTDQTQIAKCMDLILKTVFVYCVAAIERFKPAFDAKEAGLKMAYREFAIGYVDRATSLDGASPPKRP